MPRRTGERLLVGRGFADDDDDGLPDGRLRRRRRRRGRGRRRGRVRTDR